jgi:hypothetical protein
VSVTGTTSLRVQWETPPFSILNQLIEYDVIIMREGRGQVAREQIPTFFGSNSFSASDLLPGVTYVVVVRGLYTEGIIGINTTLLATTDETGEEGRGKEGWERREMRMGAVGRGREGRGEGVGLGGGRG